MRVTRTITGCGAGLLWLLSACNGEPPTGTSAVLSIQKAPTNSGDNQTDTVFATLAPFRVLVKRGPAAAAGVSVSWTSPDSGLAQAQSATDASGIASLTLQSDRLGTHSIQAAVTDASGSPVTFTVTIAPGHPTLRIVSGNGQSDTANARLLADYVVRVSDIHGNAFSGVAVDWAVMAGGGSITPTQSTTDQSGYAAARYTLGPDTGSQTVTATAAALPDAPRATFVASAFKLPPVTTVSVDPDTVRTVPGAVLWLQATPRYANGIAAPQSGLTWSVSPSPSCRWSNCIAPSDYVDGLASLLPGASSGTFAVTATKDSASGTAVVLSDYVSMSAVSGQDPEHFCALSPGGRIYCIADGGAAAGYGVGGKGSNYSVYDTDPVGLVAVRSGLTFSALSGGGSPHPCALTTSGAAYCWGYGVDQLGTGGANLESCGTVACSPLPVAVAGGLRFTQLASGAVPLDWYDPGDLYDFACGLTSAGAVYCWGANARGQLGDGTRVSRSSPMPVSGGLSFTTISAGTERACGLVIGGTAFCWGAGYGATPAPVPGGLSFTRLAGTCALTGSGEAYCWGGGYLGDSVWAGTTPAAVHLPAGVTLVDIAQSEFGACGLTSAGDVYCWGVGSWTGTDPWDPVPVYVNPTKLGGGLTFGSLGHDGNALCGLATTGEAYCQRPYYGVASTPEKVRGQP